MTHALSSPNGRTGFHPAACAAAMWVAMSCTVQASQDAAKACRAFDVAEQLPPSFINTASGLIPQKKGSKDPDEVFIYENEECICATRMGRELHLDYADTPDSARFTCAALSEIPQPHSNSGSK